MARQDWTSANIPIALAKKLEEFLESSEGKEWGFSNRNQLIVHLIRDFLQKWEQGRSISRKIAKARGS